MAKRRLDDHVEMAVRIGQLRQITEAGVSHERVWRSSMGEPVRLDAESVEPAFAQGADKNARTRSDMQDARAKLEPIGDLHQVGDKVGVEVKIENLLAEGGWPVRGAADHDGLRGLALASHRQQIGEDEVGGRISRVENTVQCRVEYIVADSEDARLAG